MSGLKERLQRLKRSETGGNGAESGGGGETNPVQEASCRQSGEIEHAQEAGWERIGGVRVERNAYGSFLLRERVFEADHLHGLCKLGELSGIANQLDSLVSGGAGDAQAVPVQFERLLFFDTETTGLGVGAGNVPFMIGLGFYSEGRFTVQQLFIRNLAEEAAMLAYFEDMLKRFDHIVSYNGRSFDWPIVQSRFVLARKKLKFDSWGHIDLLYPARSLWKKVLPSCRLSVVESDKLGFLRKDDVPGSMAPVLYVQYLAERDPYAISGVFVHNEHDIVSLAALSVHMAKLLSGEEAEGELGEEELLRLSLWLDKLRRTEHAQQVRARLGLRLLDGGIRPGKERLLLELAAAYKKRGRHDLAAELWRRFVADRGSGFSCPIEPYIELAMYCEHKERRFDHALDYAEEALNRVWKRMKLTRIDDRQRELAEALQRRIRRLRDKQRLMAERNSVSGVDDRKRHRGDGGDVARGFKAIEEGDGSTVAMGFKAIHPVWPNAARVKRLKPEYVRESLI